MEKIKLILINGLILIRIIFGADNKEINLKEAFNDNKKLIIISKEIFFFTKPKINDTQKEKVIKQINDYLDQQIKNNDHNIINELKKKSTIEINTIIENKNTKENGLLKMYFQTTLGAFVITGCGGLLIKLISYIKNKIMNNYKKTIQIFFPVCIASLAFPFMVFTMIHLVRKEEQIDLSDLNILLNKKYEELLKKQ